MLKDSFYIMTPTNQQQLDEIKAVSTRPSLTATDENVMPSEITIDEQYAMRLLVIEDARRIMEILEADPMITRRLTWVDGRQSIKTVQASIRSFINQSSLRYGILDNGKLAGYIGAYANVDENQPRQYCMGYFVDPSHRAKRLAEKAARALIEEIQRHSLVDSLALWIAIDNAASQKVARCLGFFRTDVTYNKYGVMEEKWEKQLV